VRQFAQKMVQDHSPGCQLMHQIAGPLAAAGHAGAQPGEAGTQAGGQPGGQAGAQGGTLNWNAIHSEIAQQCLQSTKQALSAQQGLDFDKGYMSQQELAHMDVVATLKALRTQASPQLRQHLDQELQTAEQHLQLAKQIMTQIKDRPSERVSRRTTESK
jgi:predicted outer membrane protein